MVHETRSLEARIRALEDIEEIRKLKARCWLSSDRKLWDEFGECFTEDAIMDVPPATHLEGRKEIVESLSSIMASFIYCPSRTPFRYHSNKRHHSQGYMGNV